MKTTIKCILLDDELLGLRYLKMLCEQIPEIEVVKSFDNPEKLLKEAPDLDFDLCILDIEMPGINGLSVANLLNDKPVIFTTAYKEFAVEAFELDAIDYITKPVKKERLQKAIDKAVRFVEKQKPKKEFFKVNTDKGKTLLYFNNITYIKVSDVDSRDKVTFLQDGTKVLLKNISFEKLQEILPKQQFCRINKGELISMGIVNFFSHDEIVTTIVNENQKPISLVLSTNYRTEFLNRM
ncbi:response regulator transcription factor [Myroides ceti]|uniref:Response regulator transcription factor n=1 Tax=Paenimyroides ceti TaxID=395087 RepID=A0ABT8CUJ9_9FLAO|nr:response regulator transcription factor [Paenimyroides ceti]MDN3708110.1 response regulator transcription factor [Paenimyroides ceti]